MRVLLAVCLFFACAAAVAAPEKVSHGRFKDVTLYRPQGEVRGFVIFLSGDGGWNLGVVSMARTLVEQGMMVAGISTPQFIEAMEKDGADCVYADGDLENLSHFVQAYAKLSSYHTPLLVGYSSGATLAYAMLAQAPRETFGGALALGFCPDLQLKKPLCKGDGVKFEKRADGKGVDFLPVQHLSDPFIALQGEIDQVCSPPATQAFIAQVPKAEVVMLPKVGHGYSVEKNWMPQYQTAFARLVAETTPAAVETPKDVSDLPVVEVKAEGDSDRFAILISGDGGWAGIDKDIAATLAKNGIPVVGLDSLRYFWIARTPEGLAADLHRLIQTYSARWSKSKVLLLGYSQGADVLPFALNRLPKESLQKIALAAPMALGVNAAFEFHLTNWVGGSGDMPIAPELERLPDIPLICIYGADQGKETTCPQLDGKRFQTKSLPGGHHFNGDYRTLAATILEAAK